MDLVKVAEVSNVSFTDLDLDVGDLGGTLAPWQQSSHDAPCHSARVVIEMSRSIISSEGPSVLHARLHS